MMTWLTEQTVPIPAELVQADRKNSRRTAINRYRSRTEVTNEHINAAYSWLRLPAIKDDTLQPVNDVAALFKTAPISRGIPEEEAFSKVQEVLTGIMTGYYTFNIVMFNTGTAAAATQYTKNWFDTQENWHEMDVATLITSAANHRINMYKFSNDIQTTYVVLNNIDTPAVTFKIATAIMLDQNPFGDKTQQMAEAWLSGNGDTICTVVNEYYAEYRANEETRRREEALAGLSQAMVVDRSREFKDKMDNIEYQIKDYYNYINELNNQLNQIKGEYLLYKLEDMEDKSQELRDFFASCGDKIAHIQFYDNKLFIVYKTTLMYYEEDILKRYFESNRGNCVTNAPLYVQQLLEDVFMNHKYDLLIESGAIIDTMNNRVSYKRPEELLNCQRSELLGLPNPHHLYFNCWGDNGPNIHRAIMEKDFITAILTTFAAMSGLNIADTAVLDKFLTDEIYTYNNTPCLKNKETGEVLTITQYERRFEDASDEANE